MLCAYKIYTYRKICLIEAHTLIEARPLFENKILKMMCFIKMKIKLADLNMMCLKMKIKFAERWILALSSVFPST